MITPQVLVTILIIAAATLLTRAFPFLIFPENKATPKVVTYFGHVLPPAILGMLVVYSLRDVSVVSAPWAVPELISVLAAAILQIAFRKSLVSILFSTALFITLRYLM